MERSRINAENTQKKQQAPRRNERREKEPRVIKSLNSCVSNGRIRGFRWSVIYRSSEDRVDDLTLFRAEGIGKREKFLAMYIYISAVDYRRNEDIINDSPLTIEPGDVYCRPADLSWLIPADVSTRLEPCPTLSGRFYWILAFALSSLPPPFLGMRGERARGISCSFHD